MTMMMYDVLGIATGGKIRRIKRIAEAFSTRKNGPFRLSGECVHIINDDTVKLGSIEIKRFDDERYYFSVVMDQVCFSYDEVYKAKFYEYLEFLFLLDDLWEETVQLICPVCNSQIVVDGEIKKLVEHIHSAHYGVKVIALESDVYDVIIKTNIGDFIVDNCKVY